MWRSGVTANTTGAVSGSKGEGETRPRQAGRRILVVEDNRDDEDRRRSHEAGFEQHLVKPVDPDALQRVLN